MVSVRAPFTCVSLDREAVERDAMTKIVMLRGL